MRPRRITLVAVLILVGVLVAGFLTPTSHRRHFRFATPRPCSLAENNAVYGRLYRCRERWHNRPTIVLLHGGGDFPNYWFRYPLIARRCNRMGFNAVTLELPYHFHRRPRQFEGLHSLDCLQLAEAFTEAIAEIRALSGW